MKARIAAFASVVCSLVALAAPVQAQRINPNRVIDMHLNVESENQSFSGSVMEGGKGFRITLAGVGSFELKPILMSAGSYAVVVYGGPEGAEAEEFRELETVTAREGVAVPLRSMPRVGLVIEGSRIAEPTAMVRPVSYTFASSSIRLVQDQCCVKCGNVTACACRVQADCGNCCVNPCCPPPQETMNTRSFFGSPYQFAARRCGNPIRDEERLFTPARQGARIASRG